jgi:hypothetical protein
VDGDGKGDENVSETEKVKLKRGVNMGMRVGMCESNMRMKTKTEMEMGVKMKVELGVEMVVELCT